jgi:ribonuclease HII
MKLKSCKNLFEFDLKVIEPFLSANEIASVGISYPCGESMSRNDIFIIGTDEAGRGPGAGGVFASAVYFPDPNTDLIEKLSFLNDSKKLSRGVRESLYDIIIANTINSTVCIEVEEIEKINILNASLKAMKLACENVIGEVKREKEKGKSSILILVDGNKLIKSSHFSPFTSHTSDQPLNINQRCIIKGDSKSASIAAASILAKVSRDRYMQELDAKFPHYNWKQNAGYLTREHLDAIDKYGITPCHRQSFLRKHFEKTSLQLKLGK